MKIPFLNYPQDKKSKSKVNKVYSRSEAVSKLFKTDDGKEFLFKGREYLLDIYDKCPRYLVLVASRQAEKTSFLSKDQLLEAVLGDQDSLLYVTSSQKQVDEYVNRKIDKQFHLNEYLKKLCFGKNSKNNKQEKIFTNGTILTFRAVGENPDSARGIVARKICFDEFQSIDANSFAIVSECAQSYPDTSAYLITGTPFSSRNILSVKYAETNQKEWIIYCKSCKKNNPPLGREHIDPDKPYLFCCHCGEKMFVADGSWIPQRPDSKKVGYRICRLMTPTCTWRTDAHDGVLDKYEAYPEAQFVQEVLGIPFDQGLMPITEEEVYANCGDGDFIDVHNPPEHIKHWNTFGAIDWAYLNGEAGLSYTIFAIGHYYQEKIEILYVKRFFGPKYHDPEVVLIEMAEIINKMNLNGVATDFGGGHKENLRLRPKVNPQIPVFEMVYCNSDKEVVIERGAQRYLIGKTVTLNLVFHRLKKQLFRFPKLSVIQTFAEDIMNVRTVEDAEFRKIKYERTGAGPDDFLHLLNYLSICLEITYGKIR